MDISSQSVLGIVLIIVLLLTLLIFLVYGLLQLIVFSIRLVHVISEERQSMRNRLPSSHEHDDKA